MNRTILALLLLTPLHAADATSAIREDDLKRRLEVVNGSFSDLRGLIAGNDGWYGGLPRGWSASDNTYAVVTSA